MKSNLALASVLALVAASANAAIITGITVESGTTNPFNPVVMGPAKAINGEGLPGGIPALTGTHTTAFNAGWWSFPANVLAQITINLNGAYAVDTIHVWNYNEAGVTGRGIRNVEVFVSPDGNPTNLVKLFTSGTGLHDNGSGDFLLPQGPGQGTYTGFDLDLSSITNASLLTNVRLVQFKAIDAYDPAAGFGLAEVQFGGTAAIPEPSTSLLAAVAGLALLRRRR
jgi:hypothetical protein